MRPESHGPTERPLQTRLAMWLDAVLLPADIEHLVSQLAPVTFAIGDGHLHLSSPSQCVLVPDVGLRVVCEARLVWPVLGIAVPVTVHGLALLVRPELVRRDAHEVLVFRVAIEGGDVGGFLKVFDARILELANRELLGKQVELVWAFDQMLTHVFRLPRAMVPLDSLDLAVLEARLRIRADQLALAVRFGATVQRHVDGVAAG